MSAPWTQRDELALRAEMERRFKSRTPAARIDEVLVETRVGRGEMRAWATETLGKAIPEAADVPLAAERARWYRQMALRVIAAQDRDNLRTARAYFRRVARQPGA